MIRQLPNAAGRLYIARANEELIMQLHNTTTPNAV
jgi:hypothetical protein